MYPPDRSSRTEERMADASRLLKKIKEYGGVLLKSKPTQPRWPNAEESVGILYGVVDGEKYWKLKSQHCTAFLAFSQLVHQLETFLGKHTEAPTTHVLWRAYMIGKTARLCALGVLFCCADAEYRDLAASQISAGTAVELPSGAMIKYRSQPPGYSGPLMPLGGPDVRVYDERPYRPWMYRNADIFSEQLQSSTMVARTNIDSLVSKPYEDSPSLLPRCFAASQDVLPGSAVHVHMQIGGTQTATLGVRIRVEGHDYFATSAHPFESERRTTGSQGKEGDIRSEVDIGHLFFNSYSNGAPELDYALIQPKDGISMTDDTILTLPQRGGFELPLYSSETFLQNLQETAVRSISASTGPILGQIETIPDFLRTSSAKLQEVYAVQFDNVLTPGDSGSWVFDAGLGGRLHGHIVAGIAQDSLAFIVPAYKVFDHLFKAFRHTDAGSIGSSGLSSKNTPAEGLPLTERNLDVLNTVSRPYSAQERFEAEDQRAGPWHGLGLEHDPLRDDRSER